MKRGARWGCAVALALVIGAGVGGACSGDDDSTTLEITFEMDKPCVEIGEEQTVTAKTEPGANVAIAIFYSDRKLRGNPPRGDADDDGEFSTTWEIPSNAPSGRVEVQILSALGQKTGNVTTSFDIPEEGATC